MHQTKITFYGGAGAVTGSNFMLETLSTSSGQAGEAKLLIDCGLRQGRREEEALNWLPFAYKPEEVSHLLVTHAHLDHVGRIPRLVKEGFRGTILSTPATRAIAEPILYDAMELLALEAEAAGRQPLYGAADIERALSLWQTKEYHQKVALPDSIELEFLDAGHILGSAMVRLTREGKVLVCTGDLGGGNSPLLAPTEELVGAHYLLVESVYGDKVRPLDTNRREMLENVIENAAVRGGTLLIPAFSTERTQDLLYEIRTLMTEKRVPAMPVYVDSPLAQKITEVFVHHLGKGDVFTFPQLHFVHTQEESHKLGAAQNPKIIIAGSGMGAGGRFLMHQSYVLPDPRSTVLIVGYQAAGTTGRRLIEGEKKIRTHGSVLTVACAVEAVYGYSAHPDGERLLEFVNKTSDTLKEVFVVEGEPASASFLAQRIRDYLGLKATAPEEGESAVIEW